MDADTNRGRSQSDTVVFYASWHYSGVKTIIDDEIERPKATVSRSNNRSQPTEDSEVISRINPRVNKYKEIVYGKNSENRRIVEAATLDQLIKAFAEETQDNFAIQRLILVHEQFVDSLEFFNRFIEHFEKAKDVPTTQFRVTNIIKKWIELDFNCFERNPKLMAALKKFMDQLQSVNPQLLAYLKKAMLAAKVSTADEEVEQRVPSPIKAKKKSSKEGWHLLDFHPKEIARQLAIIDWELTAKIPVYEVLKSRWVRNEAPFLEAASQRVNAMAYWFAWNIVSCPVMKQRVAIIVHIIKIAKHLMEIGDFNALMAVYLAVNFASVARMTQTWKAIPAKYYQLYQRFCSVMSPKTNFMNYRQFIAGREPPMVLCQEVFLKDLLYHEDGKDNFIAEGVLDMAKMDQIAQTIEQLRACQQKRFPFVKVDPIYDFLLSIPTDITVEVLDRLSQENDPSSITFNMGSPLDSLSKKTATGSIAKLEEADSTTSARSKTNPISRIHSSPTTNVADNEEKKNSLSAAKSSKRRPASMSVHLRKDK